MARGAGPPGHVKPDAFLGARCVDSACGTRPASTDGGRGQARGAQILETETGGEFGRQLLDAYESNWVKQTQLGLQKHSFRLYFVDCKIKKERTFHSNGVQTNRVLQWNPTPRFDLNIHIYGCLHPNYARGGPGSMRLLLAYSVLRLRSAKRLGGSDESRL